MAAKNDMERSPQGHPAVNALASMGTSGAHPANVSRDIDIALALDKNNFPQVTYVSTWVKNRKVNPPAIVSRKLPIWLPIDIMDYFYSKHPAEFRDRFLGGPNELARWWASILPGDPRLRGSKVLDIPDHKSRAIPIRLHGDGVPFGKGPMRSLDVVSFSSPLGSGSSLERLFPCIAVPSSVAISAGPFQTKRSLWKTLLWNFSWLSQGIHPRSDWNSEAWSDATDPTGRFRAVAGEPVCGGEFLGFMCMIACDLDYLSNSLRLRHFNALSCCFSCLAELADTDLAMTDVSPTAKWKSTLETDASFKITNADRHILWNYLTLGMIIFDCMHILDLGILQYFLGSALLFAFRSCEFRGLLEHKSEFFWGIICLCYSELRIPDPGRIPQGKFNTLLDHGNASDFPYLGSKAAVTRRFVPCLRLVLLKLDITGETAQHIRCCLECIERLYQIMFSHQWNLGDDVVLAQSLVNRFCAHQNYLCHQAASEGQLYFQVTVKTHMFEHCGDQMAWLNPVRYWCYTDEDLMGRIAFMAQGVVKGVNALRLSAAIFRRHRQLLYIKWLRRQRQLATTIGGVHTGSLVW